jgi:hypothetical protein|tara:strand:- start:56 stop:277 length:222 start_codon:yes stop_codon:yes gene_type:complete
MKWENTYLVFEVAKGPKVIIETLNTYGDDGWECCSQLIVAGSQIVCFLKRRLDAPEPVNKEEEKISKLWSNKE